MSDEDLRGLVVGMLYALTSKWNLCASDSDDFALKRISEFDGDAHTCVRTWLEITEDVYKSSLLCKNFVEDDVHKMVRVILYPN